MKSNAINTMALVCDRLVFYGGVEELLDELLVDDDEELEVLEELELLEDVEDEELDELLEVELLLEELELLLVLELLEDNPLDELELLVDEDELLELELLDELYGGEQSSVIRTQPFRSIGVPALGRTSNTVVGPLRAFNRRIILFRARMVESSISDNLE
jgi:hypothetical protein